MKFVIAFSAMVAVASAQFGFSSTPRPYQYRPTSTALPPLPRPIPNKVGDESQANIIRHENDIRPDGSFKYVYETENGIFGEAEGTPRDFGGNPPVVPIVFRGSFGYTAPNGEPISISYVADENGYQPQGDSLPTPPPIPAAILRALEFIARNAPSQKQ